MAVLLSAGCFVDLGPLPSQGAGGEGGSSTGGSTGGTTATDTGGTGVGGTGGTGGGTTSAPECTTAEECDDTVFCSVRQCTAGKCVYSNKPKGTLVVDESPTDCARVECDGNGGEETVPDDDDAPDEDPADCTVKTCSMGQVSVASASDGTLCGTQPSNQCKKMACSSGECGVQNKPDGTPFTDGYPEDCATAQCFDGQGFYIGGDNGKCGGDPTPDNCLVPFCDVSSLPGNCIVYYANEGKPCKKTGGASGTCNKTGDCM